MVCLISPAHIYRERDRDRELRRRRECLPLSRAGAFCAGIDAALAPAAAAASASARMRSAKARSAHSPQSRSCTYAAFFSPCSMYLNGTSNDCTPLTPSHDSDPHMNSPFPFSTSARVRQRSPSCGARDKSQSATSFISASEYVAASRPPPLAAPATLALPSSCINLYARRKASMSADIPKCRRARTGLGRRSPARPPSPPLQLEVQVAAAAARRAGPVNLKPLALY